MQHKAAAAEDMWNAAKPASDVENTPTDKPIELPVLDLGELMKLDVPDRAKLLPWLPEGGLAMVYGPRGVGKTFFTLGVSIALATGGRFLRWETTKPAGVLMIDGEMALTDIRDRITHMLPETPASPLNILSHEQVFNKMQRDINMGVEEWQSAVKHYLEEHPDIRVVVLENLSCLLPTIKEDARDDWAENVVPFLLWLRRRNISVLLIHHAGKGGDQRGTSAREDGLDTIIRLKALPDHDTTRGAEFLVTFTKSRSAYGDEIQDIEARLETDADGNPDWSWKPIDEGNEARLLRLVEDGIDSVSEAAEELGLTRGAVSKIKKRLSDKDILKKTRTLELAGD